jgi:hypothetical protein
MKVRDGRKRVMADAATLRRIPRYGVPNVEFHDAPFCQYANLTRS